MSDHFTDSSKLESTKSGIDAFDDEVNEFEESHRKKSKKSSGDRLKKTKESKKKTQPDSDVEEVKPKKSKKKAQPESDSDVEEVKPKKRSKAASSDSDSDVEEMKPKKKSKKRTSSDSESDIEEFETKSKSKKKGDPKPSTSKGKTKGDAKKVKEKTKMTEEKMKPTILKKVSQKNAPSPDPSSLVKTAEHRYPFVYKGTTYYCNYLPDHFQEQWDGICKMRKAKDAPVDTLGAGHLADPNEDPATQRFQTLISIILSSQTPDDRTASVVTNLKNYGLTVQRMMKISPDDLLDLIRPVSYNTGKVKYIKETAQILHEHYNDDVPKTRAEIQTLPGCGPKVSNLAMWCCWKEITGLAIDTHMERIFGKRLKWSSSPKRDKQMKEMESWMPK